MNTEQLYAFKAAAETRSFTKAADTLMKSQSAVTQLVRSLEKEMDTELFVRHTRPVRMTQAGETFYPYALKMLEAYEAGLEACAPREAESFCLNYMTTFVGVMDRFLSKLKPEYVPGTVKISMPDFTTSEGWQPGNLYLVREETVGSKAIERCPAYESGNYVLVPEQMPLAQKESITLRDLRGVTAVLPPAEMSTPFARHIRKHLSTEPGIVIKDIQGLENGLMYALKNSGVCFCTEEFLRPMQWIRGIPFADAGTTKYCFAAVTAFTPEMKAFIRRFKEWYKNEGPRK